MATSQTEVSINNRLYLEKANEEVSKIVIIPEWQKLLRSFECELSATKMEDRYRVEASRAKAQKMGASSWILRLFENDAS